MSKELLVDKEVHPKQAEDNKKQEEPLSLKKRWIIYSSLILIVLLTVLFLMDHFGKNPFEGSHSFILGLINEDILIFILVGFVAQMIDGALGMAYGVTCQTFLMSAGITPAAASAGVHVSKIFTSGVSGFSHWRYGNVNKKLFKRLILPGMIGAIIGAYFLTHVDGKIVRPFVSAYLVVMGFVIIKKAFNKIKKKKKTKGISPLALLGGFVDSIGGGGWGPVVTSTLIGSGRSPKYTIGSVNLAEFFVAIASAATFTVIMELENLRVIMGLILGGIIAAPIAAIIVGKVKTKYLMILVGALIALMSLRTIIMAFI